MSDSETKAAFSPGTPEGERVRVSIAAARLRGMASDPRNAADMRMLVEGASAIDDLAEAVALLRVTQWGPEMGTYSERHCNDCGKPEPEGHGEGCKLAAFLARVDPKGGAT